jgi:hypothetical protein
MDIFQTILSDIYDARPHRWIYTDVQTTCTDSRSMYIVYDETENHNSYKVHAIVRMANFKVIRNLVSESLYEEISFYSFLGTRILSSYSKAYFASLSYHCVIRRGRKITMMVLVFRLIHLPPTLLLGIVIGPIHSFIYIFIYWLILASRSLYYWH